MNVLIISYYRVVQTVMSPCFTAGDGVLKLVRSLLYNVIPAVHSSTCFQMLLISCVCFIFSATGFTTRSDIGPARDIDDVT